MMMIFKSLKFVFAAILLFICMSASQINAAQVLFTPELIVTGEYNDNIYLSHENEVDDFITRAGIGLTGEILGRTAGLEIYYNPTFNSFSDNSDLNFWRHSARLLVYKQLTRNTRIELNNDYLETEDPTDESPDFTPDDPTQGPGINPDLNRRGRNRYRTYAGTASINNQFGSRDNVELSMRYAFLQDIDTVENEPVNDYTDLRPSLDFEYWFTQRWGIETNGYYSNRKYEDSNDRDEYTGYLRLLHAFSRNFTGYLEYRHTELRYDRDYNPDTDIDYILYEPSMGVRYEFQQDARFNLSIGYLFQDLIGVDEEDDYGLIVNSEIAKRWSFRTSYFELTGGSGYQVADRGVSDLGLNIYYTGRIAYGYSFTNRLGAEVYGSYRYDDYPRDEPELREQLIDTGCSMTYQALQWMNIELSYRFRDLISDNEFNEYTENRALMTINLTPSSPFRLN